MSAQPQREALEDKRSQLISEIETTESLVQQKKADAQATLTDFQVIENQIENRKALIDNITTSIALEVDKINVNLAKIDSLKEVKSAYEIQLGALAKAAYIKSKVGWRWTDYFSFRSLNEAFIQWRYENQFATYFNKKKEGVELITAKLNDQNLEINEAKNQQEILLAMAKDAKEDLDKSLEVKQSLLQDLQKQAVQLEKELALKNSQRIVLNDAIESSILGFISSRNTITQSRPLKNEATSVALWPTVGGRLITKFGTQSHPTLQGVKILSNGIDIAHQSPVEVRSIKDGTIVVKQKLQDGWMVMLSHGGDFTVYSRLTSVTQKVSQTVFIGEVIGKVEVPNQEDLFVLHFEYWRGKEKVDPMTILPRK